MWDRFATGYDALPDAHPGRDDYRVLAKAGWLVGRFAVVAYLDPTDGAVVLERLYVDQGDDLDDDA